MKKETDHTYLLTLTVRNRPGVLVRCAQIFNRRGHNIESLNVSPHEDDHDLSTMTITAFGKLDAMNQIVAQLSKLIDVVNIAEEES